MNGGRPNQDGLTVKQAKFVKHYAGTNGNGTKAAQLAGYKSSSDANLAVTASENLRKPKVARALKRTLRQALNSNDVLLELSDVALKRPKIKGSDKMKALELIGRAHGMFVDKVEHSSPQDEVKAQIIQEVAQRFGIGLDRARLIVVELYGEDPDYLTVAPTAQITE